MQRCVYNGQGNKGVAVWLSVDIFYYYLIPLMQSGVVNPSLHAICFQKRNKKNNDNNGNTLDSQKASNTLMGGLWQVIRNEKLYKKIDKENK